MSTAIKIGVSACLLGNPVRYDGGHQHDPFITDTLGRFFDYVPVCPEFEGGLGAPRETMCLMGDPVQPRLVTTHTAVDRTDTMLSWARQRVRALEQEPLAGFIVKGKSPSCGMERVKVYPWEGGPAKRLGVGLFARVLMDHFPLLPVEDEGGLHDPARWENFVERLFACQRWRELKAGPRTLNSLLSFHRRHKLQILAHSERHWWAMVRLLAQGQARPLDALFADYEGQFLVAMSRKSTVSKLANVLRLILGCLAKALPASEKKELQAIIDQYWHGTLPLNVPLSLLMHYEGQYGMEELAQQSYLHPHPLESQLKNLE